MSACPIPGPMTAADPPKTNSKPRIVATYDYRDAAGDLVFQSVRREPGADGGPKDFRQRRPDGNGGWLWNLKGVAFVPYRLPELLAAPPERPVFIVEGEKDVETLARLELIATTNPMGAGKWRKEFGEHLKGRNVFILPDNDDTGRKHAAAVVKHLHGIAAATTIVELPGLEEKGDVSDWLSIESNDQERLLTICQQAAASPPCDQGEGDPEPPAKELKPLELPDDPHRQARLFIAKNCQHSDGLTLRFWREQSHRWDGSAYRVQPEKELRAELTQAIKADMDRANLIDQKLAILHDKPPPPVRKVTGRLVADVAHALASMTILPGTVEAPAWLRDDPFRPDEFLACRNGLVHLPSFVTGEPHFFPPTPGFFSPNALEFDFNAEAPEPTAWLKFLSQLWPDDPGSIGTLQEWFGYLLTPDTRQQKILLLVGPKRAGKGTIARVIRCLIGPQNVAGPTLASLGTNFGLWPLLGKTAAIINDARLSGRSDIAVVTERLLSISGEDAQTIDRKNLPPVTAKLATRLIIITNELPRVGDSSGALAGRMIVLHLTESWYGKEDTHLTDRLVAELPGILLWTIAGWQRLQERGHFVQPAAGREMLSELEDLASPVGAFVRECCVIDPGRFVSVDDLYERWKLWCERNGRREPGTQQVFGRDLLAAVPTLRRVRPRQGEERFRGYDGIALR